MNNQPSQAELDYINFLVAEPSRISCTELSKLLTDEQTNGPAHDRFTQMLRDLDPSSDQLWREAAPLVGNGGLLILDDTTLDKPYSRKIELVYRHWSGLHRRVVSGINLLTLFWTDGVRYIPCDYRIYDKANDGLTKNDHFRAMLNTAKARGLTPQLVSFDSWYSSLDNLKCLRELGWHWLTRLKSNRLVSTAPGVKGAVSDLSLTAAGTLVHLQGYGYITVFRLVTTDGDIEHWATDWAALDEGKLAVVGSHIWKIEQYHRALKQLCGVERSQARRGDRQRNHIGMSIRAFLRLEVARLRQGRSWYESKREIIREALRAYLHTPLYNLTINQLLVDAKLLSTTDHDA